MSLVTLNTLLDEHQVCMLYGWTLGGEGNWWAESAAVFPQLMVQCVSCDTY